jgi:hypothetical protein
MSVQLIVFPQLALTNEFVIDGTNFNAINTSSSYDAPSLLQTAIDNQPPSVVNTWYRYRTTGGGTPTLPTEVSGNLTLYSVSTNSLCGVYQKLSNLVVGNVYEIVIDVITTGAGLIVPTIYDGSTFIASTIFSAGSSQVTYTFTATSVNQIVVISYSNTTADNIVISNISVSPQGVVPTNTYLDLQDGQVICDLYEDEDIPLSLSVDDFKNVAEKVQSYSKAFNLPATKRNNQIFDNIFEVTRTDTGLNFNPYKKTKCILKQDGFLLFEGYLRMIDISDKEGEISYNVNLYSEVIALADVLGERTFNDLDFSELKHDYNLTNIQATWGVTGVTYLNSNTSGFRSAATVKYPFVDWSHQFTVGASGNPVLPNLESAFRPFINIKYLIDRIFVATDFTYESAFFDTADFGKLFMDFNWGSDNAPVVFNSSGELTKANDFSIAATYTTLPFDEMDFPLVGGTALDANFGYSAGVFTAQEDGQVYNFSYDMDFIRSLVSETLEVEWLVNGVSFNSATTTSTSFSYSGNFTTPPLSAGDTVLCQAKSSLGLYDLDGVLNILGVTPSLITITTSVAQTTTDTLLGTLRGELGQWDFLKGLLTMFNLVTLPDANNPSNIKIEPYGDVFINNSDSTELDWTDKIDISEMKLTPLTDLNKSTIFKFVEDDDDFAFMNYKNSVGGHLYGSKKYDASGFTILSGKDEIVAEPFAATVVKPLMSQYPDFITPAVYSYNPQDDTSEGFENSPRIMFENGEKTLTSCTYYIPPQNGVGGSAFENQFLQFSHLTDIPTVAGSRDFHFGECQLVSPVGSPVNSNLFNLYWLPYYNELYNPDTRIMNLKVNLNPSDINTFKMYDTVFIKNRTFRVNKIDYKPNDLATVEFILIP